jgi:hypothetical protein
LNIYDKNSKILRVVLTRSQVEKLIDELAVEMGKLIAIYYLNGISSIDLHGQNLMVGIPLNPDRQGMVAVRDISDNWVFNYAPTNYAQLKYGAIPEPNWCQALYGSQAEGQEACVRKVQKLTLQAFESMAQKLNFKPEERKFSDFNNTKEIYEHLLAKPDKYKEQIINTRKIFKTNRLPAAKTRLNVRCLRSVGCPYARATVTP